MYRALRYLKYPLQGLLMAGSALILLSAAACSDGRPKRVSVSGRVTIDGKPLETGFVQVVPHGNRPACGEIGPDGRFELTTFEPNDGCVLGKHPLAVMANKPVGQTAIQWLAPKKYANPATSGLTLEVTGARDDVEITLSWNGGKPFIEHIEEEIAPGGKK